MPVPVFFEILGALRGIIPPPGGGSPRVGWGFLGKTFVTKIFISPLSSEWVASWSVPQWYNAAPAAQESWI